MSPSATPTITGNAQALDLSPRFVQSSSVVGSPATNAITSICTITIPASIVVVSGIWITGWAAFTVGTNGTAAKIDIRQASTVGAVVATSGATTVVAANLWETGAQGFDAAAVLPGQVYVLCLTITAGSAISTVSAVNLAALII